MISDQNNRTNLIIAMGASAGGIIALGNILSKLDKTFPLPILITKHLGRNDDLGLLRALSSKSLLPIEVAKDKLCIQSGTVYLAPSGYHMLVEHEKMISLSLDDPVAHSRPSIDVLFQSAARIYGTRLISIVLTGANQDGADGVRAVKKYGGTTVVQCPTSAEVSIMPQSSIDTGCVDYTMTLEEISTFLEELVS